MRKLKILLALAQFLLYCVFRWVRRCEEETITIEIWEFSTEVLVTRPCSEATYNPQSFDVTGLSLLVGVHVWVGPTFHLG